jgi:hypothetical protein
MHLHPPAKLIGSDSAGAACCFTSTAATAAGTAATLAAAAAALLPGLWGAAVGTLYCGCTAAAGAATGLGAAGAAALGARGARGAAGFLGLGAYSHMNAEANRVTMRQLAHSAKAWAPSGLLAAAGPCLLVVPAFRPYPPLLLYTPIAPQTPDGCHQSNSSSP